MANETVLDVSTLIVRPQIKIDGQMHDILSPSELSVVDHQRFALWGQQITELSKDEARAPELETLVSDLARKVCVGVPDDVFAKLTGTHKFDLVEVFTMLLLRRKADMVGAIGKTMTGLPTGEASSPASSGSTAGRRAGGSTKRR